METLPLPRASIALGAYPFVLVAALASSAALTRLGASPSLAVAGAFAVALVTTAVLERVHPFERAWNPPWRAVATLAPSVRQDAIYLGLIVVWQWVARWIAQLLGALVALSLVGLLGPRPWPYGAPTAVQCLLAFALADLAKYGLHRLAHEHPWLWRFHAEHHAPERLHSLNGVRFHPINALWNLVLDAGVPLALGLGPEEMLYIATLRGAVSVLQHANIDVRLGPLDWIFSTPVLHRWHHSAKLEEANANYGSTLIV